MVFDPSRVQANAQKADDYDLLDRVTVWRNEMEPDALEIIEAELKARGIDGIAIAKHAWQREQEVLRAADGIAYKCCCCHAPAVAQGWAWHRLWGKVPVFPRHLRYCRQHAPAGTEPKKEDAD